MYFFRRKKKLILLLLLRDNRDSRDNRPRLKQPPETLTRTSERALSFLFLAAPGADKEALFFDRSKRSHIFLLLKQWETSFWPLLKAIEIQTESNLLGFCIAVATV